jgi:hypothetical protein
MLEETEGEPEPAAVHWAVVLLRRQLEAGDATPRTVAAAMASPHSRGKAKIVFLNSEKNHLSILHKSQREEKFEVVFT